MADCVSVSNVDWHISYSGSAILVPTRSTQNSDFALSLRRSAGSVRDVSHSPATTADSTNHDGRSPSTAELAEPSGTAKRLTASTGQLGASNAKRFKGTAAGLDDKLAADADGKDT